MKIFKKYTRCMRHKLYLEERVHRLHYQICMDAVERGMVDPLKRELLIKYNERLKKWKS